MKHYRFKIRPQFLELIENGSKKHEYRLNTPDRSCIKNGDRITLISNQDSSNTLMVKAVSKEVYSSWEDALKENWEEDFKEKYKTFDEVLSVCYKFYDRDMVKKYGIIKIGISPIKLTYRSLRVMLDTNIIIHRESHNNVSFEVSKVYKWLDTLKCQKILHPNTKEELEKYNDANIRKGMAIKLDSYETIIPSPVNDEYFIQVVSKYAQDGNSQKDNEILYQVYDGLADLLITNDQKMLAKARELGIRKQVISVDEYLSIVEKKFPKKVDYKMLSVKKERFGDINLDDPFFDTLKEDYPGFEDWFHTKNTEEAYVFKQSNSVHGFLYVKTEYEDEADYLKTFPPMPSKKRLKVGTFKIDSELKGFRLGERFLKIIFDNAIQVAAQEIYVTLFENHRKEIDALKHMLMQWGFVYHGYKISANGKNESIFIKTLEKFDSEKDIRFNFPNIPNSRKMFMLPINPEYHTDLFPDSILKNEDMSLYSENKGHLYSLGKIYVSGTFKNDPRPGDLVVIYRKGERYPKKYSSVCTGLAVLEGIDRPKTLDEYLALCKNKSVFTKEELINFYLNKKYTVVIRLIVYKTYFKKISLSQLIDAGMVAYDSGPRTFDAVPDRLYSMFIEEE